MPNVEIKGKALVIDDEEYWRGTIALTLKLCGYISKGAGDLATVMETLASEKFDLITIDMQFKEQGNELGEIFLAFIRKEYPSIACVMISGSVNSFSKVEDLKDIYGLGAFVQKNELSPLSLGKAIERAKKIVEREQQQLLEDYVHTRKIETLQEYQLNLLELEHTLATKKTLIIQLHDTLTKAEINKAMHGIDVPIRILHEVEGYQKKISETEKDMEVIKAQIVETKLKINELEKSV